MSEDIIRVSGLTKKFGNFTAVDNISFSVKKGEIFAFLGPNGAGKTTTIRMLTTLLSKTAGEIHLNGFNVFNDPNDTRKSIGMVFQDPSLDEDLTAYENMEYHAILYHIKKKDYLPKIEQLMKFVDLWDNRKELVKNYSGGMKRRLEIARALMHTPKILFLDEPTIGLDPQTRNTMWKRIRELNKKEGMTVFFTTHYIEEAEKAAHTVAIIDHGKIIERGSPRKLIKLTKSKTLEDAFLKLTGHNIREELASDNERFRRMLMVRR